MSAENKVMKLLMLTLLSMVSGMLWSQRVETVDLGLSVKWANMNVGAKSPEDYGDYFAWGEVSPKRYYGTYSKYKHFDAKCYRKYNYVSFGGSSVMDDCLRLQASDDAATKRMGKGWRMPTEDEMNELLDTAKCVISMGKLNVTLGLWVTRRKPKNDVKKSKQQHAAEKNDSLFLPLAGYRDYGTYRFFPGTQCFYWTSTLLTQDSLASAKKDSLAEDMVNKAMCLGYTGESAPAVGLLSRKNGCVIRAVRSK